MHKQGFGFIDPDREIGTTDFLFDRIEEPFDDFEFNLSENAEPTRLLAGYMNTSNQARDLLIGNQFRSLGHARIPNDTTCLKSTNEIPSKYRKVFKQFPYFNMVQSTVFDDVFYGDENMVISAPTSSGKTVILELAIVRLLMSSNFNHQKQNNIKIIYMAPLKSLCFEKLTEWKEKFEKEYQLKCVELTGDTDHTNENDLDYIERANLICTTPEKWDLMTRKWKNRDEVINSIKLFLVDEIHVLGENTRGGVIEAVISRMKTYAQTRKHDGIAMRFIAVSATIPNIEDFATWLSSDSGNKKKALVYKLNDTFRPVKLKKVVLGFYCPEKQNEFCFDMNLNYKLAAVIKEYSDSKPTLIFCSTRKGTLQAALTLAKTNIYHRDAQHKQVLAEWSKKFTDPKLRELVKLNGIGIHHAGMTSEDRRIMESLFLTGDLLVLFSTSTLSIGINLPAHLVIIKSTMCYSANQTYLEYSTSQILQMIGRAGRPQFDDSATAVIMTKMDKKKVYDTMMEGAQVIESQLHTNLLEHLNVELVLGTIRNLETAITWLQSTFLYVRLFHNPAYYGIDLKKGQAQQPTRADIDDYLRNLCLKNLTKLISVDLIEESPNDDKKPMRNQIEMINRSYFRSTFYGQLMARYSLAFETMQKLITSLRSNQEENINEEKSNDYNYVESLTKKEEPLGEECIRQPAKSLIDLIKLITFSKEFEDIKLRMNEKTILNTINNQGKVFKRQADIDECDKNQNFIRHRLVGKIKTVPMKINVLIQAQFGCLNFSDFSLNQDAFRVMRFGQRISKCILEYLAHSETRSSHESSSLSESVKYARSYYTFINAAMLHKCFAARLWHDSPHVFKQFARIGITMSQTLISHGIQSFNDALVKCDSNRLELILNKTVPFGNMFLDAVRRLPRFKINFELLSRKFENTKDLNEKIALNVCCQMENYAELIDINENNDPTGGCSSLNNPIMLIIGDENDNLIYAQRLTNGYFIKNDGTWNKRLNLSTIKNGFIYHVSLVMLKYVGLDVHGSFELSSGVKTTRVLAGLSPKKDQLVIREEIERLDRPEPVKKQKLCELSDKLTTTVIDEDKIEKPKRIQLFGDDDIYESKYITESSPKELNYERREDTETPTTSGTSLNREVRAEIKSDFRSSSINVSTQASCSILPSIYGWSTRQSKSRSNK